MNQRHLSQTVKDEVQLRKKRAHVHQRASVGERIADRTAAVIGSWRFIIIQTVLVIIWICLNVTGIWLQWDLYPFVLLNLMFSVQAAYTGPILLLASNRAAQKDRLRDDRDDAEIGEILEIQHEQVAHDTWTKDRLEHVVAMLEHTSETSHTNPHLDHRST